MSIRANLIVGIIVGFGVLLIAFKWGEIGGAGGGAEKKKNPFLFWLGVSMTIALVLIALLLLIGSAMPDRFDLA